MAKYDRTTCFRCKTSERNQLETISRNLDIGMSELIRKLIDAGFKTMFTSNEHVLSYEQELEDVIKRQG